MPKFNPGGWEEVGHTTVHFFYDPETREIRIPLERKEPGGRVIVVPILSREVDGKRVYDCRVNTTLIEAVEEIEADEKRTPRCHKASLEDIARFADCGCFEITTNEKGDA